MGERSQPDEANDADADDASSDTSNNGKQARDAGANNPSGSVGADQAAGASADGETPELPPADAQAQIDAELEAPRRTVGSRVRRLLPWISLAVGVASAIMMDRGSDRSWIAASAAVLLWVTLVALQWLARSGRDDVKGVRRMAIGAARFSSLMATQSLVQLTFFFALPFYFQAATWDAGHALFLVVLCVLSLASLWDPLTEWLLHRPGLAAILPAAGTFVALTAVLPGLGLSTRVSLWLASLVAAAGVPILSAAQVSAERRRMAAILATLVSLCLPASLYFGGARFVPAAPLKLVRGEMGVHREGKWIGEAVEHLYTTPEQLICATAIYAPLGLHDRLFHVWHKDGIERARIELEIVGGRKEGYRTQSRISRFARGEVGEFSCTVETATGQILGTRSVRIGKR